MVLGTPQGSILSPFFFNILVNALVSKEDPEGVYVYSYEDAIILVTHDMSTNSSILSPKHVMSVDLRSMLIRLK